MSDSGENYEEDNKQETGFILQYENFMAKYKKTCKEMRELKNDMKKLLYLYKQDIKKTLKTKAPKRKNIEATGFNINEKIPDDIAELIEVDKGSEMPRTTLTKKIYEKLKERKLYYNKDKRIMRADDQILKIFNLDENVNQVTNVNDPNGFTFYTIQTHLAKKFKQMKNKDNNKLKEKHSPFS
jgi:hypothetical protein